MRLAKVVVFLTFSISLPQVAFGANALTNWLAKLKITSASGETSDSSRNTPTPSPTAAPKPTATSTPKPTATPTVGGTRFGVLVNAADSKIVPDSSDVNDVLPSSSDRITVAKSLGVNLMRIAAHPMDWTGKDNNFETMTNAGFKVAWNLNVGAPPSDLNKYTTNLKAMLTKYTPELVVIENEQANVNQFYNGSSAQYITQLRAAVDVVQQVNREQGKHIRITDGGMIAPSTALAVYTYLYNSGQQSKATDFAQKTLPYWRDLPALANHPTQKLQQSEALNFFNSFAMTPGLDYINIHWYSPDLTALQTAVETLRTMTGKPIVTNEFGVQDVKADSAANYASILAGMGFPYVVWYSGDSVDAVHAKALHCGGNDVLRDNGKAFHDYVVSAGAK